MMTPLPAFRFLLLSTLFSGLPIKQPVGRRINVLESDDRDSVQTEDYESHFNHLMVKHLAGVPLRYYDGVSVASDLDSFRSTEVQEKVELLKSGKKPKPLSRKKKPGKDRQKKKMVTSTPHGPRTEPAGIIVNPKRVVRKKDLPQKLNLHAGSLDSYDEGGSYYTEISDYMGCREGPHSLMDSQEDEVSEIQESQLSQKMKYLINAEQVLISKVKELETSMGDIQTQKKAALNDLKSLQDIAHRSRTDIQGAETIARESVEKAEEIRSEMVVLEYQRDQARRGLREIEQNIASRSGNLPGPAQQHRMIRSLDNIHLMTSPSLLQYQDSSSLRQLNSVPPQNRKTRHDYPDRSMVARSNRGKLHNSEDDTQDCLSDSSTNQSSMRIPPIHPLLDDSEDQDDSLSTPHPVDPPPAEVINISKPSPAMSPSKAPAFQEKETEGAQLMQQVTSENADLRKDLEDFQKKLRTAENNLHKSLQESSETQNQLQREVIDLRNQLHEKVIKLGEVEGAIKERDDTMKQVRQQLVQVQENAESLQKDREKIISEKTEECQRLETVKEVAFVEIRETLLEEKEGAIQQLRFELDKEKNDAVALLEEQLERMKESSLTENQEKYEEIIDLRGKVRQLEESKESLGVQMRKEAEERIQKAISAEREVWRTEAEQTREMEKRELEGRLGDEIKRSQQEMENMEQDKEHLKTSVKNLKEENNKLREENLAAGREKVEAVSEAREETRKDIQIQLDNMREDMTQEKLRGTEKLKEKLKHQEEEICSLKSEVKGHLQREKESLLNVNVEKIDRSLIHDLNDECKKTANVLGLPVRKVPVFMNLKTSASMPIPSSFGDQIGSGPGSNYLRTRTQLHTAVANMKLTNEDLRSYAKKMKDDGRQHQMESRVKKSEIEKLQSSISNDKEESRANIEEIEEEHQVEAERQKRALHKLKAQEKHYQEQLTQKDHDMEEVQRNMRSWKEETALKMAQKFEEELNRELEQRVTNLSHDGSINNLSGLRSLDVGSSPSGVDNTGTLKVMKHLQDKVKQLKRENILLKRPREGGEDNSGQYGAKDQQIYKLNQKVKLMERQLSIAEERCRENAGQLSESTLETSRLESALTQQTKELMRMERAYDRLSKSPSPYGNV